MVVLIFYFLDADEAISSNFKENFSIIKTLEPGQSLELIWLAMWKSLKRYKNDNSVWSNNYKDFIYRDDKKNMITSKSFANKNYKKYDVAWPTHPERTPGRKKD